MKNQLQSLSEKLAKQKQKLKIIINQEPIVRTIQRAVAFAGGSDSNNFEQQNVVHFEQNQMSDLSIHRQNSFGVDRAESS